MELAALAIEAATAPAIGGGLGFYLDQRYGWSPWGTVGGVLLGALVAARLVVEIVRKTNGKNEKNG